MRVRPIRRDFKSGRQVIAAQCCECQEKPCCRAFIVLLTPKESQRHPLNVELLKRRICALPKKQNGDCIYLEDAGCSIWPRRPESCREYTCDGDERLSGPVRTW